MQTDRDTLLHWAELGRIEPQHLNAALELCSPPPRQPQWQRFIKQLLLWSGVVALATSATFFFAYNWQALHYFAKFGLAEAALILATLACLIWQSRPLLRSGTVLLLALLTGALLALIGQTYQTGADPWQLFAIWAALITPLAVISHSSPVWLLWVALINLSLLLYYQTFHGVFGLIFSDRDLGLTLLILNSLIAAAAELASHRYTVRSNSPDDSDIPDNVAHNLTPSRLVTRCTLYLAGVQATWLALEAIFSYKAPLWLGAVYLIWLVVVYLYYRYRNLDIIILSGCALSAIIAICCGLLELLEDDFDGAGLLLISLVIIVLSTLAAVRLQHLYRLQQSADQEENDE